MGSRAGKLTVGDLSGKRPPAAKAVSSWWRHSPQQAASAPSMKGFCCGSGCAGCPYFMASFEGARA